ncbi:MAG TPA: dihydrodipicolinate synthase family protein [Pyrinomonadaceae bacterium]|jgi:4-hydroxy-2-oxoglutarate aldolase|nr:dihydrodipicolinate synthase family protein [Pyrinomonadaceae bacterium]
MIAALPIQRLRGILLPSTTPFQVGGQIDKTGLTVNLNAWTQAGVSGFVVLGSTGERVHLDEREYLEVIEASRCVVPRNLAFLVGAGQQSTVGTIAEVHRAADAGADAVLVITPHFYRSAVTQETLIFYYNAVADASPVPVMLYSMPALTGIKIEPDTIARLSEHPNIIGVKDSSNDMAGFKLTVKLCPDDFAVMTGNGTVLLDALKCGATGGILAVGCAVPGVCVEILRLFTEGDLARAEDLQTKLTPFAAAVTTRFGIGGLKAALDLAGYQGGSVRAPLTAPDENQRAEIADLMQAVREKSAKLRNCEIAK